MKKQTNNHDVQGKAENNSSKKPFDISSYVSSIDTIVKGDSKETLGTIFSRVTSSHTPVFIYTKEKEFLGLVSPYQALYSSRHSYSTIISSIAINPPNITIYTPLYDVASYMLESRVYVLPVFDDDRKIKGVIHIKEVFQNILKDQDVLRYISSTIKTRAPVTSNSSASVGDIYQIMLEKHVSRVVLVDNKGKLAGIVTRNDLLRAFVQPTEKQRFGKNENQPTNRSFDKEKEYRKDNPISNYSSDIVNTLPHKTRPKKIIQALLSSSQNSIVLVDKHGRPVGILSMRDILTGFASLHPEETINLIIKKPTSNVSEDDLKKAEKHLTIFGQKMNKRIAIEKIEVTWEEPKTSTGGSILFNISLIISPVARAKIISNTKNRSFINGVHSAIAQIEKQQRRSNISKAGSKHTSS